VSEKTLAVSPGFLGFNPCCHILVTDGCFYRGLNLLSMNLFVVGEEVSSVEIKSHDRGRKAKEF
jgi:hypothetical protein